MPWFVRLQPGGRCTCQLFVPLPCHNEWWQQASRTFGLMQACGKVERSMPRCCLNGELLRTVSRTRHQHEEKTQYPGKTGSLQDRLPVSLLVLRQAIPQM